LETFGRDAGKSYMRITSKANQFIWNFRDIKTVTVVHEVGLKMNKLKLFLMNCGKNEWSGMKISL
jgi:hypothetical protein